MTGTLVSGKERATMKKIASFSVFILVLFTVSVVFSAYHHEGEQDSDKFLAVYPDKVGTKLDHCALCHSGGQYEKKPGKWVSLGSCQWCHHSYGYDGSGNISDTMNQYGKDFKTNGRNAQAIVDIENLDSDGDGYTNIEEIEANRFPGDAGDDPTMEVAQFRIYTRAQLEALGQHRQFLLMNASRKEDHYSEYTGVPMEDLLQDAGILASAEKITVYAPDGWSQDHPLAENLTDPEAYHVNGSYPQATFHYDPVAEAWCYYDAPSCAGRSDGDPIVVEGGPKMILAYAREGSDMDPGLLDDDNKLDGEGPFRVVPPQKNPGPPDQPSSDSDDALIWPYDPDGDHNAGASTRTVTIIKISPLPAGKTDIDVLEAGWAYVDQEKVIVYGAIDDTDSNNNGILDSEEGTEQNDYDNDGIWDYMDTDTAQPRHSMGEEKLLLHTPAGALTDVKCLCADDPEVPQTGKPSMTFPYGTTKFKVTGLALGQTVIVTLVFPGDVPTSAKYYKISTANGWQEIPFGSNNGDNTITLTLTDGDPLTDGDGVQDGTIDDPGALATPFSGDGGGGGSGGCFIATAGH
jgi:hypothetical protein